MSRLPWEYCECGCHCHVLVADTNVGSFSVFMKIVGSKIVSYHPGQHGPHVRDADPVDGYRTLAAFEDALVIPELIRRYATLDKLLAKIPLPDQLQFKREIMKAMEPSDGG